MGCYSDDDEWTDAYYKQLKLIKMLKSQILILLFTLAAIVAFGQESTEWKTKYNKDGITAMTRKVIGSPYLEYKIQTNINGSSVEEALDLITNGGITVNSTVNYRFTRSYPILLL